MNARQPSWTPILGACLLATLLELTGCLSRPALKIETFTFNSPVDEITNTAASHRVLGIRKLQIAAPFEGRSLVYRTGDVSYVRDPYAAFLEFPAEELMSPVRESLRRDGDFRAVVSGGSALKADTLVEININQLYGDFRQRNHPLAVLNAQFTYFDALNGVPGKVILQREYSRSLPLDSLTATALMKGWDQALAEILADVSADFARAENESGR
jgi:ABC-type uncharacterized transport system auxiliary subunit